MIRVERKEILFFLGYLLHLTSIILEYTVWAETINDVSTPVSIILKYIRYLTYAIIIMKIIVDQTKERNIWYIMVFAGLLLLSALGSTNKTLLFYCIFIIGAKDISINRILKVTLFFQTVLMLFVMGASIIGIIPDYIFDVTTRMRHSYGFVWTTIAPIMFFFMTVQYIYLRRERMRLIEFIILEAVHYFFFIKTNSRMCFVIATFMLMFFYVLGLWRKRVRNGGDISWLFLLIPSILCLFSISVTYFYNENSKIYQAINDLVSDRLQLGKSGMTEYGFRLFGTQIKWIGNNYYGLEGVYNYVDSSYVQILLEYGIAALTIIIICYTYIIYRGIKYNDSYLVWAICFVLFFSVTEPRLINFAFHPFLIMTAAFLSNSEELFWKKKEGTKKIISGVKKKGQSISIKW